MLSTVKTKTLKFPQGMFLKVLQCLYFIVRVFMGTHFWVRFLVYTCTQI